MYSSLQLTRATITHLHGHALKLYNRKIYEEIFSQEKYIVDNCMECTAWICGIISHHNCDWALENQAYVHIKFVSKKATLVSYTKKEISIKIKQVYFVHIGLVFLVIIKMSLIVCACMHVILYNNIIMLMYKAHPEIVDIAWLVW